MRLVPATTLSLGFVVAIHLNLLISFHCCNYKFLMLYIEIAYYTLHALPRDHWHYWCTTGSRQNALSLPTCSTLKSYLIDEGCARETKSFRLIIFCPQQIDVIFITQRWPFYISLTHTAVSRHQYIASQSFSIFSISFKSCTADYYLLHYRHTKWAA